MITQSVYLSVTPMSSDVLHTKKLYLKLNLHHVASKNEFGIKAFYIALAMLYL